MKYLLAYTLPIASLLGIYFGKSWCYLGVIYAFILIPFLEIILPKDATNLNEERISRIEDNWIFDSLLYLNIPIVYGSLWYSMQLVTDTSKEIHEWIGIILSLGIILGANGINVAHELGHRKKKWERILGKILLIPTFYMHFYVEHNLGHHVHVATPEDPSTAKYNQNVYAFWYQTIIGTYKKAWQIQLKLNKVNHNSFFSFQNDMFWFTIIQISYLLLVYFIFNTNGLLLVTSSGIVGFLLLETINYIEHYGLKRTQLPSGRYERVTEKHSWNSNHIMGRILLYELTRHSDHHYKASKKYQILEYHDESPQMPFGYPTSMVIALFPPLWFSIMNKKVPETMK